MVLNDTCKRFVQGIMERRFVIEEDAIALLNLITGCNSSTKSDLDKMIKKVNDGIKKCHVEIKQQVCDLSSKNFIVFVSCLPTTSKDENFDKFCYAYSNTERDFFKSVLEEIITSEERCVRRNTALNLTVAGSSQSQSWGPHQYNQALLKFQEDGWLAALDEGKVFLGARAIAELEHMLLNDYKVESCKLCSRVCVRGFICDGCAIMTHFHCEQKFSERKRAQGNKCPTCESEMRPT